MKNRFPLLVVMAAALLLSGCVSSKYRPPTAAQRFALMESIQNEPRGNYFIGCRYYKADYKFWGYIRRPGESWSEAKLVLLNENAKFAPDRAEEKIGGDNGFQYRLNGRFSGETVYDPASNGFYPEFVLTGVQVVSTTPPPIYHTPNEALNPSWRAIIKPY